MCVCGESEMPGIYRASDIHTLVVCKGEPLIVDSGPQRRLQKQGFRNELRFWGPTVD